MNLKNIFRKKTFFYAFIILIINIFAINQVFAIYIISREKWGAEEKIRYLDHPKWQAILEARKKAKQAQKNKTYTEAQKKAWLEKQKRLQKMYDHINKYFADENRLVEYKKVENGHPLAWPIGKTNYIKAIVIHHTHSEYKDKNSLEGIKSIYRFHSLSRQWGDIGYNYIVGYNGEIFEGRAGGDFTIGAHAKWNNRSTIGISVIGDYSKKGLSPEQKLSLERLIYFLAKKYGIDFNKKVYFHKTCVGKKCKAPIYSFKKYPLIGHRDVGHTSCPGDKLYAQIQDILHDMQLLTKGFKRKYNKGANYKKTIKTKKYIFTKKLEKKLEEFLNKIPEHKMLVFGEKLEEIYDKTYDFEKADFIEKILDSFHKIAKKRTKIKQNPNYKNSFEKTHDIKVKLSYPGEKTALIAKDAKIYDIKVENNKLFLDGEQKDIIILDAPKNPKKPYLEIISWDRKPSWDKTGKYNDNKFRGQLIFYVKDNKLQIINKLKLHDYLKGLGEISNSAEKEKIKTIIIAARTYARWYLTKDKKFKHTDKYEASDDPNVFQKYLGYEYERRSPNVNKVVEETIDEIITYNGKIIKPWYFNKSNGWTKNFKDYCKNAKLVPDCSHSQDFPFLSKVKDPGSKGKYYFGHGVGISGAGASYFAKKGWSAEMIIKYFLKGVNIEKK